MGLSVNKFGARYKAVEQAMSVLAAMRVTVNPVQRRWKYKNYPDMILATFLQSSSRHSRS